MAPGEGRDLHRAPVMGLALYKVKRTDRPCVVCRKPIQPGQLYAPGPCHIGCREDGIRRR